MKLDPESVILCEGYHDRAFLRGWLVWRGCEDLRDKPYRDGRKVTGRGQYAFRAPSGGWLRIVPVHGDSSLLKGAAYELETARAKPLSRLVIVRDDDGPAAPREARLEVAHVVDSGSSQRAKLESWAEAQGAQRISATDDLKLDGGFCSTVISFIVWSAPDLSDHCLPPQQTLERLVCAAVAEARGPRGKAVEAWIASRPEPPADEKLHKTYAASHMAGWFSDRGYEGFFDAVWQDSAIRAALLARLDATRAAPVVEALVHG